MKICWELFKHNYQFTNMTLKERFSNATRRQWFWLVVWVVITILFSIWAHTPPAILLFIFLVFDIYITNSYLGLSGRNLRIKHSAKPWNGSMLFCLH